MTRPPADSPGGSSSARCLSWRSCTGHAVAGGLELALACDAVLAEAGTLIGDGHMRNHLVPGAVAAVRMRRKLGDSLGPGSP